VPPIHTHAAQSDVFFLPQIQIFFPTARLQNCWQRRALRSKTFGSRVSSSSYYVTLSRPRAHASTDTDIRLHRSTIIGPSFLSSRVISSLSPPHPSQQLQMTAPTATWRDAVVVLVALLVASVSNVAACKMAVSANCLVNFGSPPPGPPPSLFFVFFPHLSYLSDASKILTLCLGARVCACVCGAQMFDDDTCGAAQVTGEAYFRSSVGNDFRWPSPVWPKDKCYTKVYACLLIASVARYTPMYSSFKTTSTSSLCK
jgi:hypothetical protein